MYDSALHVHSWLRWAVLLLGVIAIARAALGVTGSRPWTRMDERTGVFFVGALDLQLLVGLILYFALSPVTTAGMRDMAASMSNAGMRFWTVEHPFGMLLGLILAHVGRVRVRKTSDTARRHRLTLIFFTLALAVILVSIPWPGRAIIGRPLFRY